MAEQRIIITDWSGATATTSEKKDIAFSAKFAKGTNPFEDPAYLTLSRKATLKSSTTVATLPHWMVDGSPWNTNRYVYDSGGKLYTVNSSDVFSSPRTVSGGGGEGLGIYANRLLYAQATELGSYYPLDNSPAFQDSFSGWWIASQLTSTGGGTGAADYVPPTSISEVATARQTFTATYDPVKSITIDVDVVGTGDWTVTLHNTNNDSIGTSTIVNGSMSTGDVVFTLAAVGRIVKGESYHFHVTSTVANGGVDTDAATDLEGAEFTATYGTLIDSTFHPMANHLNILAVGNENYLATFDGATYNPNRLRLPFGFQVRAITKRNEFLVIEAFKGTTVREAEAAERFYWDGIEANFNYSTPITIGACNAIGVTKNQLIGVYGHRGSVYKGDELEETFAKIPKLVRGKYVEVFPGAIDEHEGRTLVGYAGGTDDTAGLEMGVYEHGSQDIKLPKVLNLSYLISTGTTQDSNLKVSMVKVFGKDIYIGWQDGATTYGVDKIALGDSALASGSWESLIFDAENPKKEKLALEIAITFEALTSGQSITPKYKLERAASFTNGTAASTVGNTSVKEVLDTRFREIEFGFNIASTSNTFPKITSIEFLYNDLSEEKEN